MNRLPISSTLPLRALATTASLALTALVLIGIDGLAQQRSISPHAQIVELERVVITPQRVVSEPANPEPVMPQLMVAGATLCKPVSSSASGLSC